MKWTELMKMVYFIELDNSASRMDKMKIYDYFETTK